MNKKKDFVDPYITVPESFSSTPFIWPEKLISLGGRLPDDTRAMACWYYAVCAHKNLRAEKEGSIYVGTRDVQVMLNNIARAVGVLYNIDPAEFLKFMEHVKRQVEFEGGTWDPRVESPDGTTFISLVN